MVAVGVRDDRKWWMARDPVRARRWAAGLLTAGAVLAVVLATALASADGGGVRLSLAFLTCHALALWTTSPRSSAGRVLVVLAPVVGAAACCLTWWELWDEVRAGMTLLALPVVFAAGQFRRAVGVVVTGLVVVGAAVVMNTAQVPALVHWLDVAMVAGSMAMVAVFAAHSAQEHERALGDLEAIAGIDPLTGLFTRRVLDEALAAALVASRVSVGTGLIIVDIDRFKQVNDVYGHPAGDAALRHVAALVRSCVRGSDSVVSRMGGDELAVVLPGCTIDAALDRGRAILDAVRRTPLSLPDGSALHLTVSVGVAQAPEDAHEAPSLYGAADRALYVAKRNGRDQMAHAATS